MKLVIVESPAKAKTIEKYLASPYTVRASVGHVRDLPKSNKNAIDIEKGFVPHYEILPAKQKVLHELQGLVKKADEIILATDPDREGEAIAWHLGEALALPAKKTKRVTFNEITKEAVREAMEHPREIDQHLRRAQEARRVLDRLVGYDLSGLIWKKVRYGLSAGRVQSPALRILMEREREIRAFIPETFFVIKADILTKNKTSLTLTCEEEPREKKEAERIVRVGEEGTWKVATVTETEAKRAARAPFTTSTLQQAASTRLGFSPSRTMRTAQKLYEAGHITYMRTDSTVLSGQAMNALSALIQKEYGETYHAPKQFKTKAKNAQEAHEAIRPSSVNKKTAGTTEDQKKLYRLIWQRTVASQMADAKVLRTKITASVMAPAGESAVPDFSANGSRTVFDGWLRADPEAHGEEVELPKVAEGETLTLRSLAYETKETQPPSRYSEAGLVKELEKRGIGRPSTYASIMQTLEARGYVQKEGRTLIPTDTGDVVSTFLEKHFPSYISDSFTAEMENELDEIADGTRDYAKTLADFYTPFSRDVKAKDSAEKITSFGAAPVEFPCPLCSAPMEIKLSRGGRFMSCSRFPECTGSRRNDGSIIEPEKPLGTDPQSGLPVYVLDGRFGPYVQLGETPEKKSKGAKPRRASIPKEKKPEEITLEEALHYLSLPRMLGNHPESGKEIQANIGRFGPYIVCDGDFRSLKGDDNPYTITLTRALEILVEEKKIRRGFVRKTKSK